MIRSDTELAETSSWASHQETSIGLAAKRIEEDLVKQRIDQMQIPITWMAIDANRFERAQIEQAVDQLVTLRDRHLGFLTARERQRAAG